MTIKSMVKKLRLLRPRNATEFENLLQVKLVPAGSGGFREAFAIKNSRVIVKFPMSGGSSVRHARREIRRIQQILKSEKFFYLRRYVPKIYWWDYKTGVIVVVMLNRVSEATSADTDIVTNMLKDTFSTVGGAPDTAYTNVGYDGRGQLKVLDWGCV